MNLRKSKLLLVGTYHSTHPIYGTSDSDYLEQLGLALDVYSNYDKFLIAGDFNVQEDEGSMQDFLEEFSAKNLVKENTCFKSLENPTCIDLFVTNSYQSFQKTSAVSTGLSDFHKMIVTILKTTFPKVKPKVIQYRDYSKFNENNFRRDLKNKMRAKSIRNFQSFDLIFEEVLNALAPCKKKVVRANHKPYVTKNMRKAIMKRSFLENKFHNCQTVENSRAYKKQKNYCNCLYKRERRSFYSNLNLKDITDNKKFWNITKPLFSDKGGGKDNIILVHNDKIISDDAEVAQTFNDFFKNSVKSLDIVENRFLLSETNIDGLNGVDEAVAKFAKHPSILCIIENVKIDQGFSFSEVTAGDIKTQIKNLNTNKAGTYMGIPAKQLKQACDIICEPLTNIWNNEIVQNRKFPSKLKLADISPIHKKLENIFTKNYRPVSVLASVSKIFEKLMQKQVNSFIEKHLSTYLRGYRKGYNSQYSLLAMIEKWKSSLDNKGDLSKAFHN